MDNWNTIGWSLLAGGFLFGVLVGALKVSEQLWLVSFAVILAGLIILVTNMVRTAWRALRRRKLITHRLFG